MDMTSLILDIIKTVVAVGGAVAAWYYFKKKSYADTVLKYAERYDKVMDAFPSGTFLQRFNSEADFPDHEGKLRLAVLKYLNLCSEEYFLFNQGYIDKSIWNMWKDELERALGSALFKREWEVLKSEFKSDSDFRQFVDDVQSKSRTG